MINSEALQQAHVTGAVSQRTGDNGQDVRLVPYRLRRCGTHSRYHPWTPEECSARECLMVHARAGLRADIQVRPRAGEWHGM